MRIKLTLPPEIDLPSNVVDCEGLIGTNTPELLCNVDLSKKTIEIMNSTVFSTANPGQMKIEFSNFRNPNSNIETSSFSL